MQFVYEGFTHEGDTRCFTFQSKSVASTEPARVFSIRIDLPLFARYRVAMQEAPMFCLQLLTNASAAGPHDLEKFHQYRVVEDDLRPILVDRERRAALKALKTPARRFVRKPPDSSKLQGVGAPHYK
jgi:hypothetical protein